MDMRFLLALLVYACPRMLDQFCHGTHGPIGFYRKRRQVTTAIIGNDRPGACAVHRYKTWIFSPAFLLVDELQLPAFLIKGKGAHPTFLPAVFIDGIQVISAGGNGEVGRVFCFGNTDWLNIRTGCVEIIYINTLAFPAGVSAHKKIIMLGSCR